MDGSCWAGADHRSFASDTGADWQGAALVVAIVFAALLVATTIPMLFGGELATIDIPEWWMMSAAG